MFYSINSVLELEVNGEKQCVELHDGEIKLTDAQAKAFEVCHVNANKTDFVMFESGGAKVIYFNNEWNRTFSFRKLAKASTKVFFCGHWYQPTEECIESLISTLEEKTLESIIRFVEDSGFQDEIAKHLAGLAGY